MARLFIHDHLTMREIGALAGMSKVSVWKRLQKLGIQTTDGTQPVMVCTHCQTTYRRKRCAVRAATVHFCSIACYTQHIQQKSTYREWRYGQKLARQAVNAVFPLQRGYVVHHHDGDNTNNHPTNHAVFASQAEHMRFHRGGQATPLWDGKTTQGSTQSAAGSM
jgi:hypothetical protein